MSRKNASVPWVAGRLKALARAVALELATERGLRWDRLIQSQRDKLVRDAEARVKAWVAAGVLITFDNEYREAPRGGTPLVTWKSKAETLH